jgi:hypothetical protein
LVCRQASVPGIEDPADAAQLNQPHALKIDVMFFGDLDQSEGNAGLVEVLL